MVGRSRPGRVRPGSSGEGDRGSVTVEAAIVLPILVVVLMLCLGGIGYVSSQVRCGDAAREAARLIGRGDDAGAAEAISRLAPAGAAMSVTREDGLVRVTVTARPFVSPLPMVVVSAESAAAVEGAPVGAGALGDGP